nr:4-hydroxy-3-methylbut-2-en-1-yl diphosphate synthase (ferredoxin), chloroplastic [Tanacetum cinerariifolium]
MSTVDMVEGLGRQAKFGHDCRGCEFCFMIMVTGAAPASFMGLMKSMDNGLGFAKTSDFIKVSDMKRVKIHRIKISVIKF